MGLKALVLVASIGSALYAAREHQAGCQNSQYNFQRRHGVFPIEDLRSQGQSCASNATIPLIALCRNLPLFQPLDACFGTAGRQLWLFCRKFFWLRALFVANRQTVVESAPRGPPLSGHKCGSPV